MLNTNRLQVIIAHNDEAVPAAFQDYAKPQGSNLSERQIRKWKSRRLAYFLLHQLFEQHRLDQNLLANIQKMPNGRPYISHPHIDFNLSHSGDWVAIIFSYSQTPKVVGIDIEQPYKPRRFQALLNHYASVEEIIALQDPQILPQLGTQEQRFYLSWCLREAVLKSQGVGIVKLAEVRHSPSSLTISSAHCPKGILAFYHQLPCYLAYFAEQQMPAELFEWKQGKLLSLQHLSPIHYQVNPK